MRDSLLESKYEHHYNTCNWGISMVKWRGLKKQKTMYARIKFLHVITLPIKNEGKESIFKEKLTFFLLSKALYSLDKLYSCEYILSSYFKKYIQLIILALGLLLRCWHNLVYFIWNLNKDNLYWIERVLFSVMLIPA